MQWGGRRSKAKAEHIADDLLMNCEEQWKEANDLHEDTLDLYLLDCFEQDFNLEFEDDSGVTEVSLILQDLYRKCAYGELKEAEELLASLEKHPAMQKNSVVVGGEGDSDEEGSDEDGSEEEGAGKAGGAAAAGAGGDAAAAGGRGPRQVVDDEGWVTTVPRGKKGGAAAAAPAPAPAAPTPAAAAAAAEGSKEEKKEEAVAKLAEDTSKLGI